MHWIIFALIFNGILIGLYYLIMCFWYDKVAMWLFNVGIKRDKMVKDLWNKGKKKGEALADKVSKKNV